MNENILLGMGNESVHCTIHVMNKIFNLKQSTLNFRRQTEDEKKKTIGLICCKNSVGNLMKL